MSGSGASDYILVLAFYSQFFLTCTDCNVDYIAPLAFNRPARGVARIGEVHLSCNLVSGSPSQSYKITLADFSFYLCNIRCSRNSENSRLPYSRHVLNVAEIETTNVVRYYDGHIYCAFEDVLGSMGFVSLITLDSADVFVKLLEEYPTARKSSSSFMPMANLTCDLALGQMNMYACRDSFSCLAEMIGDLALHLEKLSEEAEVLAARSATSPTRCTSDTPDYTPTPPTKGAGNRAAGFPIQNSKASPMTCVAETNIFQNSEGKLHITDSISTRSSADVELYACIPDNELSAKELRRKHGIIEDDDIAIEVARALLIKNYYTVDTRPNAKQSREDHRRDDQNVASDSTLTAEDIASAVQDGLLLDGYEWTTVDHGWSRGANFSADTGQHTEWFRSSETGLDIQIFPNHVAIDPVRDPLAEGDMNAKKIAGTKDSPHVQVRLFVRELSVNCRFFTGCDWDTVSRRELSHSQATNGTRKRKDKLLGSLLEGGNSVEESLFNDRSDAKRVTSPRTTRQVDTYFELSLSGVRMRLDSFSQSTKHRLASCMDLKIMNLFFSESISSEIPVKLLWEWVNDVEHPRDADDGMVMMKVRVWFSVPIRVPYETRFVSYEQLMVHLVDEFLDPYPDGFHASTLPCFD